MADDEIVHKRKLLEENSRRLRELELTAARLGNECPPSIKTEIEDLNEQVVLLKQQIDAEAGQQRFAERRTGGRDASNGAHSRAVGQPTPERIDCPYPGMIPFRDKDARFFHGRESEIQQMLSHVRHQHFLLVVGPSGSGKSSLVRAGFLPRLARSGLYPQRYWLVRQIRPGDQPMRMVEQIFARRVAEPAQALDSVLSAHTPAQRLLLVVDQFEELFTQADRAEQTRFLTTLKALRSLERCVLLIAMRADFYPDLMISDLWPISSIERLEIAPLRGDALRQAILVPAQQVGVEPEPGLVEELLADAADEPGILPLIQETMQLLWERMDNRVLTLDAYRQLGGQGRSGLAVAIVTKANATLNVLSTQQQTIARRIFLRLVQFGEGRTDTRRQQPVEALRAAGDTTRQFEQTLRHLTDNRLLTLSGERGSVGRKVDLAHEALISGWPTLQEWLSERREAERARRRLADKANEWSERIRRGSGGGLLDEIELLEAERWLNSPDAAELGVDAIQLELVKASRTMIDETKRQHAARVEAEAVRRQLEFLQNATMELDASLEYETTLAIVARLAVPHLADWCAVDVVEEDSSINRLSVAHVDPAKEPWTHKLKERYPPDPDSQYGVARVLRTGDSLIVPDAPESTLTSVARDAEHQEILRQLGLTSYMIVPLQASGRVLGTLLFVIAESGRRYGAADRALAEDLARRAAAAVERARLYRAAREAAHQEQQRARQLRELANASLMINSVLSLHKMLQIVTDQARTIIGAHQAAINIVENDHWERSLSAISLSDKYAQWREYDEPPNGTGIYTLISRTNRPMRLTQPELEAHPAWRGFGDAASRHPPMRGWLAAPLISRDGGNLGLIHLSDKDEGQFTEADEAILVQLAQMASVAFENVRLYQESQSVMRANDKFLSNAAHELKNPLTSLLGHAALMLRRAELEGTLVERDQRAVKIILQEASRLNKLMEAILNLSRIQTGRLNLHRAVMDLVILIRRLVEEVQLTLTKHRIEFSAPDEPLFVEGDEARLEQVLQHVILNAIKYSPSGGLVLVRVAREGGMIIVTISDQGIGIPQADLPKLFRRFYRSRNAEAQNIKGMGIGLYVVKEVIHLHNGRVDASSVEGVGTTFTISLPLSRHTQFL